MNKSMFSFPQGNDDRIGRYLRAAGGLFLFNAKAKKEKRLRKRKKLFQRAEKKKAREFKYARKRSLRHAEK